MRGWAALALLTAALAAAVWSGALDWRAVLLRLLTPSDPFVAAELPAAPDYTDLAAWTAHPDRPGLAAATPDGLDAVEPARAPAAVFYVHPTTYVGFAWNASVDDAALNAQTDELATKIQASAFNGCCAIYGPRYRQANGQAFVVGGADADAAIDVAYQDVRAAFHAFREREAAADRPFLLASHSQGTILARRLLVDEILGTPLAALLVAAYLIGGPVDGDPGNGLEVCDAPTATRCLVAWNARGPGYRPTPFEFASAGGRACVNPLTWRRAGEAPASANPGAVFLHAGDGRVLPGFASARCRDGALIVELTDAPPRDVMSRILDRAMGPGNFHPIEFQLFYMAIRANASARIASHLEQRRPH